MQHIFILFIVSTPFFSMFSFPTVRSVSLFLFWRSLSPKNQTNSILLFLPAKFKHSKNTIPHKKDFFHAFPFFSRHFSKNSPPLFACSYSTEITGSPSGNKNENAPTNRHKTVLSPNLSMIYHQHRIGIGSYKWKLIL